MSRSITTHDEWEALPVGTLARVGYLNHDDDDLEIDDGTMFVIRAAGNIRANADDYGIAGGKYWSDIWHWQQGITVADVESVLPEPMYGPGELSASPLEAAVQVLEAAGIERARAAAVIGRLQDLGWTPPVAVPEGVQVWTVTGKPAREVKMDGTMAYMSLPDRTGPDRGALTPRIAATSGWKTQPSPSTMSSPAESPHNPPDTSSRGRTHTRHEQPHEPHP